MIDQAISLLVNELNAVISSGVEDSVIAANIAFAEDAEQSAGMNKKIVLTLVNLDEEITIKNGANYVKRAGEVEYKNRPVNLNLYLLFSANFPNEDYLDALKRISQVIEFFQKKKSFSIQDETDSLELEQLRMVLDLHTITFEQVNYLWGSLGGRQYPFVLYKARIVSLEAKDPSGRGPYIEEIHSKEQLS